LAAVFRVGCFGAFRQRNRLLLFCGADGFAERSLNLGFVGTNSREKHATEPVQFGTVNTLLKSFSNCYRLLDCLKSFRSTIR
jgi:hypothetical protein